MTLDTAVLADLALKAEAATPGPWWVEEAWVGPRGGLHNAGVAAPRSGWPNGIDFVGIFDSTGKPDLDPKEARDRMNADAAYIAAFNPQTAAALLAEVESLRNLRAAVLGWLDCPRCSAGTGTVCMTHRPDIRAALVSEEGSR